MMITVVWPFIAIVTVSVYVAGSKYEALDGENVTMPFESKLERVDEVKVVFEGENKGKILFAHYCFRETDPVCDIKSDHLQVKGRNVSLILLKVNSSSTGLYSVRAFFGKEVDDEVTATLVVKKPLISFSAAPPQTSSPKSPNSSEYQGLLITGVIISCGIIIVVLAFHYFWNHRRILSFHIKKGLETPPHSECVTVSQNNCGENLKALLPDTECLKTLDNVTNTCSNCQSESVVSVNGKKPISSNFIVV